MQDEILLTLNPPIEFNGKATDSILLKEPTAAQLQKGGNKDVTNMNLSSYTTFQMEMVMAVSGLPVQIVGQMKVSDLKKGFDFIMSFISDARQIGPT